jgi:hypothetical protein
MTWKALDTKDKGLRVGLITCKDNTDLLKMTQKHKVKDGYFLLLVQRTAVVALKKRYR